MISSTPAPVRPIFAVFWDAALPMEINAMPKRSKANASMKLIVSVAIVGYINMYPPKIRTMIPRMMLSARAHPGFFSTLMLNQVRFYACFWFIKFFCVTIFIKIMLKHFPGFYKILFVCGINEKDLNHS